MNTLQPKIYVACLAAYNEGILYGSWIDANQSVDDIWDSIKQMLAESPIPNAEEIAIHDYKDFGGVRINEYSGIDEVAAKANFIAEHGKLGAELLIYYGGNIEDASKAIEEHYLGEFKNEQEFAQSLFEDCHDIPDYLADYIDYERVAYDLFINDYMSFEVDGKTHVFSCY